MNGRKLLVCVVGPTASGKSDLAVSLAMHYGTEIVSADSRQVYRGIPIGTAQPPEEDLRKVRHHLISFLELDQDFNCGEYERISLDVISEIFREHDIAVAVGGSGLYVKALCEGMDDMPDSDPELRKKLEERLCREGLEALTSELGKLDPEYYATVDRSNPQRVLRALEVCLSTSGTYSSLRRGTLKSRPFDILKIGIDLPRDVLYGRINRRVDMMMELGLEEEARKVCPKREFNSLRTVGYTEMFAYFDGKTSREEAVNLIKQNTRHYAKRQMTWFRRDGSIVWIDPSDLEAICRLIDSRFGK